jgi:hypothetical protein
MIVTFIFTMIESQNIFQAGASSAVINPPLGSFVAGDAQNRRFEAVHDDIYAKAIVFDDGEMALAIVTVDCIGLTYDSVVKIRKASVAGLRGSRLSPEQIVVASTHIHNGPDVVGLWGEDLTHNGVDPDYMEFLIVSAAAQVVRAYETRVPATLSTVSVSSHVDWVRNECEPDELDMTLSFLRVSDSDEACIATLTNFACHPTILDGLHDVVSCDWVGGLYRELGEKLGGEHLFLQGAIGGWVQPVKGDRSFELADRYGRELATEVIEGLRASDDVVEPGLQFASTPVSIPLENPGWVQLIELGIIQREQSKSIETEMASFVVGDAYFMTHPGETPPEYSHRTREIVGAKKVFVVGLGLDALGYILKPDYFEHPERYTEAEYLIATSVGPAAGPVVMEYINHIAIRNRGAGG